jgi:uncharacterized phage protein gp47/JayE
MAFGINAEGFTRKNLRDILLEIETDQKLEISPTIDVSSESVLGQLNGIFARQMAEAWEALEACYHGFDPDAAEGFLLTALAKLTGTTRRAPTQSVVTLTVNLDSGTELVAGDAFAAITDKPDVRWTPREDFIAPSDGDYDRVFLSENTGAIVGEAGTIEVIATPIVGWNSVTNAGDASLGHDLDSDETLRTRREDQLAATGSSTIAGLQSDVLAVENVETAACFENFGDTTDSNGLPPHSFEVLVYDGVSPAADDNEIAQAIWDTKPAGIRAYGLTSGNALDADGVTQEVEFSRLTVREVYVEIDLDTGTGYAGDAAVKSAVVTASNARFEQGDDVDVTFIAGQPYTLQGVSKVTAVRIGFSASPTGIIDLTIGPRELARFDTSRVVVSS